MDHDIEGSPEIGIRDWSFLSMACMAAVDRSGRHETLGMGGACGSDVASVGRLYQGVELRFCGDDDGDWYQAI